MLPSKQSPEFYQIYTQCRQITSLAVTFSFSLIADKTSDICNQEQVSICIRYCTNALQSDGIFLGFYETCKTGSSALSCSIGDELMRLGLDISGLRGQGYDGGSNMAGKINGLEQKMLKENLKALYFHCIGHQLNLVCQNACTKYSQASHPITCVNKIVIFVKESPKRCGWFAAIQASSAESTTVKLRPLCSQGRSQKKIERGPNFATFNVTSFTYNGLLPFVNYARRYYKNC